MGQTTDQIENDIEHTREDLKSNLEELESRVKSATDWRHYYRKHTGAMIAVAFGGGILLSSLLNKREDSPTVARAGARSVTAGPKHEALQSFESISRALVGAAAMKFKGLLGEVVPGFSEHLAQVEGQRTRDATH
jgi:hypothetical protein